MRVSVSCEPALLICQFAVIRDQVLQRDMGGSRIFCKFLLSKNLLYDGMHQVFAVVIEAASVPFQHVFPRLFITLIQIIEHRPDLAVHDLVIVILNIANQIMDR